jgi:hypothetical protein
VTTDTDMAGAKAASRVDRFRRLLGLAREKEEHGYCEFETALDDRLGWLDAAPLVDFRASDGYGPAAEHPKSVDCRRRVEFDVRRYERSDEPTKEVCGQR